jgi:flagellar P-ring protein precursor FlgI
MKRPVVILIVCLALTQSARGEKIGDIVRLHGERTNQLIGMGLVVGLPGTGDGGDFLPAIKPLASMLSKLNNNTDVRELTNAANVALVSLSVTIPAEGARDGEELDVYVTSVGAAKSIRGGRLVFTPLTGPVPGSGIYAAAQGPITIEDAKVLTHGVVKNGAVMEADFLPEVMQNGRINLVLLKPFASWTTASTIAKLINDAEGSGETLAVAVDAKNIVVTIPANERAQHTNFIDRVLRYPVPSVPNEARVQINEKTGTIIITGDVEILPVVISHKGLTITTVTPPSTPTVRTPQLIEHHAIPIDPAAQGGARLQELVDALDLIKVPAEDRITIVKELYKTGKLRAKLILE